MVDVQNEQSVHQIYLNQVGIKSLKYPVFVQTNTNPKQAVVATFNMSVGLAADKRGTHMSRFVEILQQQEWVLSATTMQEMLAVTAERFKTDSVQISASFNLFINKTAPISGASGLVDYEAEISGSWKTNKNQTHKQVISYSVAVPLTTLCPCSKEISDYGAHSQRSRVKITISSKQSLDLEELIKLVESEASCEIYSVLKRADEKYVTERAYNNPRFVEDIVRNVAHKLNNYKNAACDYYKVESENFESIHNHSAYAMVEGQLLPTTGAF